jgi:hypothetical protein
MEIMNYVINPFLFPFLSSVFSWVFGFVRPPIPVNSDDSGKLVATVASTFPAFQKEIPFTFFSHSLWGITYFSTLTVETKIISSGMMCYVIILILSVILIAITKLELWSSNFHKKIILLSFAVIIIIRILFYIYYKV